MPNNDIELFFTYLSQRRHKENDLSDVTWAMCQASQDFFQEWIHFFFPNLSIIECVDREIPATKDSSRADFIISCKNDSIPYVIEVKIWDQNHHFGQYEKAYEIDKSRLGYITNYKVSVEGYDIKQWADFHQYLTKKFQGNSRYALINGYCEYIKTTCNIISMDRVIDINKMSGLYDLSIVLHNIVERSTPLYSSTRYLYKGGDSNNDNARAICIKLRYENNFLGKEFFPGIGIWFDQPLGPRICGGFWKDAGWGKELCEFLSAHKHLFSKVQHKYTSSPFDDWGYWFYMSDDAKANFSSAMDISSQEEILSAFLDEILTFPLKIYALAKQGESH